MHIRLRGQSQPNNYRLDPCFWGWAFTSQFPLRYGALSPSVTNIIILTLLTDNWHSSDISRSELFKSCYLQQFYTSITWMHVLNYRSGILLKSLNPQYTIVIVFRHCYSHMTSYIYMHRHVESRWGLFSLQTTFLNFI